MSEKMIHVINTAKEAQRNPAQELPGYVTIDSHESNIITNATRLDAHAEPVNGQTLNSEILTKIGLGPAFMATVDGKNTWLSNEYSYQNRPAIMAYVDDGDGRFKARTYYKSNSNHTWRFLPGYDYTPQGNVHYSKGYAYDAETPVGENHLDLPAPMQHVLSDIEERFGHITLPGDLAKLAALGTVGTHDSADYLAEVSAQPEKIAGMVYSTDHRRKVPPGELILPQGKMPNFDAPVDHWQQTDNGNMVRADVFVSHDGSLRYLLFRDQYGRAWVGNVESGRGKISSTGLSNILMNAGDLTTPVDEYLNQQVDQTGGYGNPNAHRGSYVDMYQNYLSKVPLIQQYQQRVGL